jgi:RND family efflux transporter MFP subunit
MSNEDRPNVNDGGSRAAKADQKEANAAAHGAAHESGPKLEPLSPRRAMLVVGVLLVVAVVMAVLGYLERSHHNTVLANDTRALAAPTVNIAPAKPGAPIDSFMLPGNVTAFTDSPIYARTDGYLLHWYYDIGARVKKGDLLAVISTPELDQQLLQAEADVNTAEANAGNAKTQADRYKGLVDSNAVSRQDTDTFVNQAASTAATVRSAQANVQRLKELQSFEKIYAPFDGVVTARNIDTGQLINQGAGNELFHMQAINTLRVYTNVPQLYSQTVKRGMKIPLTFPEHPGKTYTGTLVRTADAIDPASRTLLVEIDVDNRDGQLMPGSLAQVHFKTPQIGPTFIVPTAALIFRKDGLQVGTVVNNAQGTVARLVPITIGVDDGASAQVVSGLSANDQVIQDPPDSIIDGEKVTVEKQGQPQSQQQGGGK